MKIGKRLTSGKRPLDAKGERNDGWGNQRKKSQKLTARYDLWYNGRHRTSDGERERRSAMWGRNTQVEKKYSKGVEMDVVMAGAHLLKEKQKKGGEGVEVENTRGVMKKWVG